MLPCRASPRSSLTLSLSLALSACHRVWGVNKDLPLLLVIWLRLANASICTSTPSTMNNDPTNCCMPLLSPLSTLRSMLSLSLDLLLQLALQRCLCILFLFLCRVAPAITKSLNSWQSIGRWLTQVWYDNLVSHSWLTIWLTKSWWNRANGKGNSMNCKW